MADSTGVAAAHAMWEQNSGGPEDGAMFQTPSDVQSLGIDEDGTGVTAGRRTGQAPTTV